MSIWQDNFDPAAEYVVAKPLLFGSRNFKIGELFDVKTHERRKRILYDSRFLKLAPVDSLPENPEILVSPQIDDGIIEITGDVHHSGTINSNDVTEGIIIQTGDTGIDGFMRLESDLHIKKVSRGWYNVVDSEQTIMNSKKLRLKDAEDFISRQN